MKKGGGMWKRGHVGWGAAQRVPSIFNATDPVKEAKCPKGREDGTAELWNCAPLGPARESGRGVGTGEKGNRSKKGRPEGEDW